MIFMIFDWEIQNMKFLGIQPIYIIIIIWTILKIRV